MTVRLRFRTQLLLAFFALSSLALLLADLVVLPRLDAAWTEQIRSELFVRIRLLEPELTHETSLAPGLAARAEARVTLVALDGRVLDDSELTGDALAHAPNHADRPEIAEALRTGHGQAIRTSATLQSRLFYVASRFPAEGPPQGVVRLAVPLTQVDEAIARLRHLVIYSSLAAFALTALVSTLLAQRFSRRLRAITETARELERGHLTARLRDRGHDELAEVGHALDQLAESLETSLGALRQERDRFERVVTHMGEGLLLLDADGRIALTNPALREMLALPADVAGRTLLEGIRNAPLKEAIERAGQTAQPIAAELELGGSAPRRLLLHAAALRGEVRGTLVVIVDVTQLRRLESLRRDFASNVSHELRTPIASLVSLSETLEDGALRDPVAGPHFVGLMRKEANRLSALVDDLLSLSRVESGKQPIAPEPIALAAFVQRFDHAIQVTLAPGAEHVRADPRALERVLSNLFDNARKYGAPPIAFSTDREGSSVRLSVLDHGPGIAPEHRERLFERFYRVDPGRSREQGGTGLGLALVKHLVEAMGSRIEVESPPGQGCRFSFVLPAG